MKFRVYTGVYALTLLLSASLLFSVQPMFSKMVLPLLGGTPQVWNTAMLFFQMTLLAGYAYAHLTTKILGQKLQSIVHLILLIIFVFALPFGIPEGSRPPVDQDPTFWQLSTMALIVGGPFFVLSGCAPMLQSWFARTEHPDASNPYFLYGASNLGSMTSLLAYPVLIEPYLSLDEQALVWGYSYYGLIVFILLSALVLWDGAKKTEQKAGTIDEGDKPTMGLRLKWLILAFIPSSLMLGVTTFITTDIASVPLLWIAPLAIYVGTFILVFARKPLIDRSTIMKGHGLLMIALVTFMMSTFTMPPFILITLHLILFFFAAMVCHTELAALKPNVRYLTEFYLIMSLGGALGGVFNALIVPQVFIIPLEYALVLALATLFRYSSEPEKSMAASWKAMKDSMANGNAVQISVRSGLPFVALGVASAALGFFTYDQGTLLLALNLTVFSLVFLMEKRWLFSFACFGILVFFPPGYNWGYSLFEKIVYQDRNFFGVIRVVDSISDERILMHGTTNHGSQALESEYRMTPLSYYSEASPVNDTFTWLDEQPGPQNVAVVGLGIGVTACFQRDDRRFDFYEIDPDIAAIAQNTELFTFLSDCGSPHEVILGDGRLTVSEKEDGIYDYMLIDVYSSDNIPVHLITREAVQIYLNKLKDNGILVFNISNKYLDIEPVIARVGESFALPTLAKAGLGGTIEDTEHHYHSSHFMAILKNKDVLPYFEERGWEKAITRPSVALWTDQYSNIVSVLGNKTGGERVVELTEKQEQEEKEDR